LAASEYAKQSGRKLLTALAVTYQVQCRLSDVAPVRAKGFDHTTQGSYAVASGVSNALDLDEIRTANAIAICGTAFNALRVSRTGALSHWKGFAYPNTAFACTHATFLAMRGITGPPEVFEGNKGFMDTIAGRFEINWSAEDLERVTHTILKKYNAEIHSQSALEGILELKKEYGLKGEEIEKVDIEIFDVAYHIIGGGEEGDKTIIRTKEEADHSLPYLLAVAILDGQVMPEQFRSDRIRGQDVQMLLRKVSIKPFADYSRRFPDEMPCRITIKLRDGRKMVKEKPDYEGFLTRPMSWETAVRKFEKLAAAYTERSLCQEIISAVSNLETIQVSDLTKLLAEVKG
jgi:2-methylcitrate dehydratase